MNTLVFLQNINIKEVVVLMAIVALFFGAKRLPSLVRSIRQSVGEFKRGVAPAVKQGPKTEEGGSLR